MFGLMTQLIRFAPGSTDGAPFYGFVPPSKPGRRAAVLPELMATMALAVCIVVAVTALSLGMSRAGLLPAAAANQNAAGTASIMAPARAQI
jgi:hypothetical protein